MNPFPNSLFPLKPIIRLSFLAAVLVFGAPNVHAQAQPQKVDADQKISPTAAGPCTVAASGEVTTLVKNGVELSVKEDWDCDSIADAYDNCVGMANPSQMDSDGNGFGDICESATFVKAGVSVKSRANKKAKSRIARADVQRSGASVKRRRSQ